MTEPVQYATYLRLYLATERERGVKFGLAWKMALAARSPGSFPLCGNHVCGSDGRDPSGHVCKFIREAYQDGFHRQGGSGATILLDRDQGSAVDPPPEPAVHARRCGSGEGCSEPAEPFLCPTHSASIRAAMERSEYRGRDEATHGPLKVAA